MPRDGHAQARVRIDAGAYISIGLVPEGAGWERHSGNTGWACRRGCRARRAGTATHDRRGCRVARRHRTDGRLFHNGRKLPGRLPAAKQGDVVGVELRGGPLACRGLLKLSL